MTIRYNQFASSGTFDAIGVGAAKNGTAVFLGRIASKVKNLSALVTVDGETDTITLAAKWQVSNDNSTWVDLANGPQNPAAVVLVTGTAGADAAVTKAIPAPDAIYGWSWARLALVVGGTTGAVGDTYSVGYCFKQIVGGDRS